MRPRPTIVAALLGILAPLASAHACSCSWGSTRNALERADAVFLGRPVAFRPSLLSPMREEVTRFRVERVWKGAVGPEVSIVGEFWDSCGAEFPDDGRRYVVFAWRDRIGRLGTGACSGTMEVNGESRFYESAPGKYERLEHDLGARMVEQLGPGSPPSGPPAPDPWPAIAGWGTIATATLLAWSIARRRRSVGSQAA
jgi:hypothetical protein